jgi:hypothetical protein
MIFWCFGWYANVSEQWRYIFVLRRNFPLETVVISFWFNSCCCGGRRRNGGMESDGILNCLRAWTKPARLDLFADLEFKLSMPEWSRRTGAIAGFSLCFSLTLVLYKKILLQLEKGTTFCIFKLTFRLVRSLYLTFL